jgi:hypothetical protein
MKTAGRRNPNRWVTAPCTPRSWCGWSELSLVHGGWEARKTPAAGEVFFLDFPLYRTYQALGLARSEPAAYGYDELSTAAAKRKFGNDVFIAAGRSGKNPVLSSLQLY